MQPTLLLLVLAGCSRAAPTVDAGFTATFGDDDDATLPPTETGCEACTPCEQAGFSPPPTATGEALVAALHELTRAQSCSDYAEVTEWMFVVLDNEQGEVECVYTGRRTAVGGQKPDGEDMNTEHSWPQSQGADLPPAECDAHHLYPTDTDANSVRASWPYGEVVDETWTEGGSRFGADADGQTAFEPRDEHKGNAARSMLYFSMRYDLPLTAEELALYRSWSALDPVDDAETERSLQIGLRQGAANPYVACPGLVDQR